MGNWLKDIGSMLDLIQHLAEQDNETNYRGEFKSKRNKDLRGAYNIRLRVGSLSEGPYQQPNRNGKYEQPGITEPGFLEPVIDTFDEISEIVVIAQMPGVSEEEIHLNSKGTQLIIEASGQHRRYYGESFLPFEPDLSFVEKSFINGILEIRIRKPIEGKGVKEV